MQRLLNGQGATGAAASRSTEPVPAEGPPAEEKRDLPPLDFFTGESGPVPEPPAGPVLAPEENPPAPQPDTGYRMLDDPALQRIRDQYVAARFTGVARTSMDLVDVRRTIAAAHTYLDDGKGHLAAELLELAAAIQPASERLWLAALELALRMGDAEGYRRAAFGLRRNQPHTPAWSEVAALARTLCLTDEPFSCAESIEAADSGPGPRVPNWLRDGWELAPEFTHADLRAHVLGEDPSPGNADRRRAA